MSSFSNSARAANPSAVVKDGKCSCCLSDRAWHLDSIKSTGLCTHEFCKLCDHFFHSEARCHSKNCSSVDNINKPTQEVVESAPAPGSVSMVGHKHTPPTPNLNVDLYQKGSIKGQFKVLPDSGSEVDNMSADLA